KDRAPRFPGPDKPPQRPWRRGREHEDDPSDEGIEFLSERKVLIEPRLDKRDVLETPACGVARRKLHGFGRLLDADDRTVRTNELGGDHGNVAACAPDLQDTHAI